MLFKPKNRAQKQEMDNKLIYLNHSISSLKSAIKQTFQNDSRLTELENFLHCCVNLNELTTERKKNLNFKGIADINNINCQEIIDFLKKNIDTFRANTLSNKISMMNNSQCLLRIAITTLVLGSITICIGFILLIVFVSKFFYSINTPLLDIFLIKLSLGLMGSGAVIVVGGIVWLLYGPLLGLRLGINSFSQDFLEDYYDLPIEANICSSFSYLESNISRLENNYTTFHNETTPELARIEY